jgi:tetratricopeptide (TPR) repeat protein
MGVIRLCVAALLLVASAAHADDRGSARDHFMKGSKAFDLGAFDEAITEYSLAYRLREDPALLYNLAQAHRLAGHAAEALRFYKVFLSRLPNAPNRAEVELKIRELQKVLDQQSRTQHDLPPDQIRPYTGSAPSETVEPPAPAPRESPPASEPSTPPPPSEPSAPSQAIAPLASSPGTADRRPRTLKVAGSAVGAFGVAGLAAGIACGALAAQNGDDLSALGRMGGTFDPGRESAGKSFQSAEAALLAVGAVAVVTGVVLFVIGHRASKHAPASATRAELRF